MFSIWRSAQDFILTVQSEYNLFIGLVAQSSLIYMMSFLTNANKPILRFYFVRHSYKCDFIALYDSLPPEFLKF